MKWINFNRSIAYFPLAVVAIGVFLLPYYYTKSVEGFVKINFFAIWLMGCLCWLWSVFLLPFRLTKFSVFLVIVVLYIVVLTFIYSDDNSIFFLITLICLTGVVRYLRIIFLQKKSFCLITVSIIVSYLFQISIGFFQAMNNDWKSHSIQGQLPNSGFFANYLAAFLPFGFSVVIKKEMNYYLRTGLLVVLVSTCILLSLTEARSALIGCMGGAFVIMFFQKNKLSRKILIFLCIVLVPIIGYHLYYLKPNSAQGRFTIYKVTSNIIKDHPVIGIGPNRLSAVYNNYQAEYFENNVVSIQKQLLAGNTFEAFNFILQILTEYGLIGFLLFLSIFFLFFKELKIRRNYSSTMIGSFACIAALLVSSLFSNPFHLTPVLLVLCYHISVIYPISAEKFDNNRYFRNFIIPFIFTLTFSFLVAWYSFNQYAGSVSWSKASQIAVYNDFSKAEPFYKKANSLLSSNGDFLFNYGAEACIGKRYERSIQLLEKAKKFYSSSNLYVYLGNAYLAMNQFEKAEMNYLTSIYMAPSHIYPKYQLIQLYKKWGRPNDMKFWRDKTLSFPIKIKSDFSDELIFELRSLN